MSTPNENIRINDGTKTNENIRVNEDIKINDGIMIQSVTIYPLVDAHMHIQGNNIAPIPIMLGVVEKTVYSKNQNLKGKINYDDISFMNLHEIPESISNKTLQGKSVFNLPRFLENRKFLTNAAAVVMEYGKVTRFNSYYLAGLYQSEVKEAQLGISSMIITSDKTKITNSDINTAKSKYTSLQNARLSAASLFKNVSAHYYTYSGSNERGTTGTKISAVFDFSILHGMELMYAHYWGVYGIPLYITVKGSLYSLVHKVIMDDGLEAREIQMLQSGQPKYYDFNCIYDIDAAGLYSCLHIPYATDGIRISPAKTQPIENLYNVRRMEGGSPDEARGTKYTHILEEVEASEAHEFEDHIKHLLFTQMAVLKYPFKYLPFYHFDPRRFFPDSTAPELGKYHDFYVNHRTHLVKLETADVAEGINGADKFHYKMSYEKLKNKFIATKHSASSGMQRGVDLGERKIADGLFWGVKMYVALGYPPYLSKNQEAKEIFPCLQDDSYRELREFYIFCADNDIPITCHCSPQGMTIADPEVYLKEYLKRNVKSEYTKRGVSHFHTDDRDFMNGLGLIDYFSSPRSWKLVLDTLGGREKELRLCLAHLGKLGFLSGEYDENTIYCWFREIAGMIENDNYNIYTDISCYTFPKFQEFPLLTPYQYNSIKKEHPIIEKIYSPVMGRSRVHRKKTNYMASLTQQEKILAMKLRLALITNYLKESPHYIDMNNTAKKLADLIKDNKKLRHRIMFGTDWPLSEMGALGVPEYNSAVFVLLQLVTRELDDKFDAWHQFAVINPLRFLGVLKGDDDAKEFTISMDKFEKMKTAMLKLNEDIFSGKMSYEYDLSKIFNLGTTDEVVAGEINRVFGSLDARFKDLKIPAAHRIKSGDEFLIIGES